MYTALHDWVMARIARSWREMSLLWCHFSHFDCCIERLFSLKPKFALPFGHRKDHGNAKFLKRYLEITTNIVTVADDASSTFPFNMSRPAISFSLNGVPQPHSSQRPEENPAFPLSTWPPAYQILLNCLHSIFHQGIIQAVLGNV